MSSVSNKFASYKPKSDVPVPKHVKSNKVSIALLTISLILAITFTVLPSFVNIELTYNFRGVTQVNSFGIWKASSGDESADIDCSTYEGNDCLDSMNSKCNSTKAFSIIGIVANVCALLFICFNMYSDKVQYLILLACASYLIIMALFITLIEGSDNPQDSNCALYKIVLKASTSPRVSGDLELGPAFYLCVVSLVLVAAAFMMLNK